MKKLVACVVFFVVLSCVACAEVEPTQAANGITDDLVKLSVGMLAAFGAGVAVAFGFKKK